MSQNQHTEKPKMTDQITTWTTQEITTSSAVATCHSIQQPPNRQKLINLHYTVTCFNVIRYSLYSRQSDRAQTCQLSTKTSCLTCQVCCSRLLRDATRDNLVQNGLHTLTRYCNCSGLGDREGTKFQAFNLILNETWQQSRYQVHSPMLTFYFQFTALVHLPD